MNKHWICGFLLSGLAFFSGAEAVAADLWRDVDAGQLSVRGPRFVEVDQARTLALDYAALTQELNDAPLERDVAVADSEFELALPLPEGGFGRFRVVESPIMEAGLAKRYPTFKTYLGQGIDDPTATLRFDLTNFGFRAQWISWDATVYIEPFQREDVAHYVVFKKDSYRKSGEPMRCSVTGEEIKNLPNFQQRGKAAKVSSGANLRTYRLAMAATGEYTAALGGTVTDGLSGFVTTMNRVNGIYEREVSVRMVLVANTDLLIYTNAGTDPYANTSGDLAANQTNITTVIGSANYDIGHLVGTGGGGVAGLGVVCNSTQKARGLTGSGNPIADAFDVDYVAHEIGHQFSGNHTFNGSGLNCSGGNRNAGTAYEPGSGITIQAYAGICAGDNLQPNSEDYFHRVSLNEILAFTTTGGGGTCGVLTATGNGVPTVTAPADLTIPISTPFQLTATGSDPNGDTLTYVWEQFDLGTANPEGSIVDTANRPIFRGFDPTISPTRVFPSLRYILNNANVAPATAPLPGTTTPSWLTAEVLPTTSRSMNFRVTARDNRAGGGGTNEDAIVVTSTTAAGPFAVTAPNTAVSWAAGSSQTITWNVAGTTANGVNTANVEIALSRDGGNTFPTILLASTPNDGTETLTIPAGTPATTQARIRVAAVGNVFFDIGNANFTITGANTAPTLTVTGSVTTRQGSPTATGNVATVSDVQDSAASLSVGVSQVPPELTVAVLNSAGTISLSATASCTLVTPSSSNKTYPVLLTVTDSAGASTSLPVNVLVGSNLIPTLGNYGNVSVAAGGSTTSAPSAAPADGNSNLVAPTVSPTVLPGSAALAVTIAANGTVTISPNASTTLGTYTISAQANDSCGAARIKRFTATVTSATTPVLAATSSQILTGDGLLEPNECNQLNVTLNNSGGGTASAISATLSSSNPAITITQANASFPNIPAGQSATNLTPFQFSSSSGLSCSSNVSFNLTLSYTGGGSPTIVPLTYSVGTTPAIAFSQNFDGVAAPALPVGWTTERTGATPPPFWATTATNPDTAPNAAFTNGVATVASNSLITPAILLPASASQAVLSFRHAWNFETSSGSFWDGGILELSTDGGVTYNNVTSPAVGGTFTAGGYNSTIASGFDNPIAGQAAWGGLQASYVTSTLQLPLALNGQTVRFRFRAGWDNTTATTNPNWRIDGLSLQAGLSCPGPGNGACAVAGDPDRAFAVGSVTLPATASGANNASRVRFAQAFDTAPVVIVQVDDQNADPQALRVSNVTASSFDLLQVEAPGCVGCNGAGPAAVVHWLAAKPGVYKLRDEVPRGESRAPGPGVLIKVGTVSISNSQRATSLGGFSGWAAPSWAAVSFPAVSGLNFTAAPVVLSSLQTWNPVNEGSNLTLSPVPALTGASQVWLTPALRNVTASGFDAALESASVDDNGSASPGIQAAETLGYVAIQAGASTRLAALGGGFVGIASAIGSATGSCSNSDLSFPAAASIIAANLRGFGGLASRNEDDGGWLRRCTISSPAANTVRVGLRMDEDADLSADRSHPTAETVGRIAFGGDFTTTPVTLARLAAERNGAQLAVEFSTATEVANLGYRIWGRSAPNAPWQRLHEDLIVGADDGMTRKQYRRSFNANGVNEVRIEDVDILGASRFHPAVSVGSSTGADPIAAPLDWSAIRTANALNAPRRSVSGSAGILAEVVETGVQRVAISALQAQGLALTSSNLAQLAVLDAGAPVARVIDCPSFPSNCELEWFGEARQSLYGPGNVYTIALNAAAAIPAPTGAIRKQATAPAVVPQQIEQAPNRGYSFSAPGEDPWFDQRLVATSAPVSLERSFSLPERAPGPVNLSVRLWGGVDFPDPAPDHSVELWLNGSLLAQRRFDGLIEQRIDVTLPDNLLSSSNTLMLRLPADTGYSADVVALDGFTLRYPRYSRASAGAIQWGELSGSGQGSETLFADGFEASTGFALEGVLPGSALWTSLDGRRYRDRVDANVAVATNATALWLSPPAKMQRPVLRLAPQPADTAATDYLIISHPQFSEQLAPLVQLQQQRGYSVRVVSTDAILARADHARDPLPIRDFISAVDPRFVLLVGGDSYDYADNLGLGSLSFVPTFYRVADRIVRFAASDQPFVDADLDGSPERAIGRVPARTNEELQRAVDSILARSNDPLRRFLAAAGNSGNGELFDVHSRTLLSFLRQGQPLSFALSDELGLDAARARTVAGLAGDADWINYLGHSSPNRWSFQNLLDTAQLGAITRTGAPAIVTQWGCWNNYFVLPNQDTMAHALMLRSNRLSAAVVGATSLAEDASHLALGTRFFDLVEDGRFGDQPMTAVTTIGEALSQAKRNLIATAPEHAASAWSITLFGDPAMPLR